jgi:hypothetical protein
LNRGWSQLASTYRCSQFHEVHSWKFKSGMIGVRDEIDPSLEGLQAYRSSLHLSASNEGLRLSLFLPFSFGKPPVCIPWSDIVVSPAEGVFGQKMRLDFLRVPTVSLYLRESLGREVMKHAERKVESAT